jgi:MFS family permease
MTNVVLRKLYPEEYKDHFKTWLSNSHLVGAIFGQLAVGWICDRWGRRAGLTTATLFILMGTSMAAIANGVTPEGMFVMLAIARLLTGLGVGK